MNIEINRKNTIIAIVAGLLVSAIVVVIVLVSRGDTDPEYVELDWLDVRMLFPEQPSDFTHPVAVKIPSLIHIPSLDITAPIVPKGLDSQGRFADPNNASDVGWYFVSAHPGSDDPENQLILLNGHNVDNNGRPAVFYNLHMLEVGDTFRLERNDGAIFTYTVYEMMDLPLEEVDMAELILSPHEDIEGVTIITCAGRYDESLNTWTRRIIVRAIQTD
ncbi:MAG: class F sortase [Pseudomonadales bacterium]|jgi:LPXTG-site transpeptidase (sortase) family protein|nr:class F sortase [Pseudomonadales bacterium]